jgi:hypothetical protein
MASSSGHPARPARPQLRAGRIPATRPHRSMTTHRGAADLPVFRLSKSGGAPKHSKPPSGQGSRNESLAEQSEGRGRLRQSNLVRLFSEVRNHGVERAEAQIRRNADKLTWKL